MKLLFVFFCILLFISACSPPDPTHFVYHGKNGDYPVDVVTRGNSTDYYITVLFQNETGNVSYQIPLSFSPVSVVNVSVEGNIESALNRPQETNLVYITQDPQTAVLTDQKSVLAVYDIGKILGTGSAGLYKIPTLPAFTSATERSQINSIPVIACSNVSSTAGVILLQLGNTTRILVQNDCIIVEGTNGTELFRAADKLAYSLLGVF
ncbi:hypothetical protein HZB00_02405 [Candidatus Woesearchaeota archaeon]|nr:hypothetical protein [Candidatus Woesearchaeota archaeon]